MESVIESARRRIASPSAAPGYECAFCDLPFDRDRLNCPACGGPVREGVART